MKLKFWGEKQEQAPVDPNEADALRGKYSYEDLIWRKRQLLANEITGPQVTNGDPNQPVDPKEEWVDTLRRARSAVTNGQGSLGRDFPHGQESAVADFQLGKLTRWTSANLTEGNALRRFLEGDEKDNFHLAGDRSIERDQPEVVMAYKPMFYPGGAQPVTGTQEAEQLEKDKKKP